MEFLLSRQERLAGHLREQIKAGQLPEPLPNSREWARVLGVSCPTLYAALATLHKEELICIRPRRGVYLTRTDKPATFQPSRRIVRLIYRKADFSLTPLSDPWLGSLAANLQARAIQFRIEGCNDGRIERLCEIIGSRPPDRSELFLLLSLSADHQRHFVRSRRPTIILGMPAPGITLPYICSDYDGSIRDAVNRFRRHGLDRVYLIVCRAQSPGIDHYCHYFRRICSAAPKPKGEILRLSLKPAAQLAELRRFSARVRGGSGIVVAGPINLGAVMTNLYDRGIDVRHQLEVVSIDGNPCADLVVPMPTQYLTTENTMVRFAMGVIVAFFETGAIPPIGKTLPMKMIRSELC